jgi:hypothetical protein
VSEPELGIVVVEAGRLDPVVLDRLVARWFKDMVKLVVDVRTGAAAVGGEFHADAEEVLLARGLSIAAEMVRAGRSRPTLGAACAASCCAGETWWRSYTSKPSTARTSMSSRCVACLRFSGPASEQIQHLLP